MSQVFYRKWRPQSLAELAGQEAVARTLSNALSSGKVAHAYLFAGPRGTGKTSTARILAKAVNCLGEGATKPCMECSMCRSFAQGQALDLIEIDAASNRGIDEIRSLREKVNFAPALARYKVYIIDEVHQLTGDAFSALLKTLEEPPPHAIFILATTESHKVPATILSRCQRFDFRRIPQSAMVARLQQVCSAEGIRAEAAALELIARAASGSLRDAENVLEQVATYYGHDISYDQAQQVLGLVDEARVRELAKHLLGRNLAAGLAAISAASNDGVDMRQLQRGLMDSLRNLLLIKANAGDKVDVGPEVRAELTRWAASVSVEDVTRALRLLAQEMRVEGQPSLPLELALTEFCLSQPFSSPVASPPPVSAAPHQAAAAVGNVSPQPRPTTMPSATASPAASQGAPRGMASRPAMSPTPPPASQTRPASRFDSSAANPYRPAVRERETAPPVKEREPVPPDPAGRLAYLKANWRRLLREPPPKFKGGPGLAFLRSGQPVSADDNTIVVEFRHIFHRTGMEKMENKLQAEEFLSDVVGSACRIRCVVSDAMAEAATDPLVQEAMRSGARIVDIETEGHDDE